MLPSTLAAAGPSAVPLLVELAAAVAALTAVLGRHSIAAAVRRMVAAVRPRARMNWKKV